MSNHLLDEAKATMEGAKRKVDDLRRQHNVAADEFNKAKRRYDRLADLQRALEFDLAVQRQAAIDRGDQLAALLGPNPPPVRLR